MFLTETQKKDQQISVAEREGILNKSTQSLLFEPYRMQQRPQEQDKLGVNLFSNSHYWTPESTIYPKPVFLLQHPLNFQPYLPGKGSLTNQSKH